MEALTVHYTQHTLTTTYKTTTTKKLFSSNQLKLLTHFLFLPIISQLIVDIEPNTALGQKSTLQIQGLLLWSKLF